MTVGEWLAHAQQTLEAAGIDTARLDALVLAEDALDKNRTHLLAHPELVLTTAQENVLAGQLSRRAKHEPLAYLRSRTEFYGREFIVTPAVLEPRPESETMIELLLQQTGLPAKPYIADIGTGSGALGITAALELKNASVDLLEIDPAAIEVARMNVIKHTTSISVIKSDLLADAPRNYDVLLCNLPYIPDNFHINEAARREPEIAIFGGGDGLDLYRRLFKQIDILQIKPLLILCESLPPQHELLAAVANASNYHQAQESDFIQLFTFQPGN